MRKSGNCAVLLIITILISFMSYTSVDNENNQVFNEVSNETVSRVSLNEIAPEFISYKCFSPAGDNLYFVGVEDNGKSSIEQAYVLHPDGSYEYLGEIAFETKHKLINLAYSEDGDRLALTIDYTDSIKYEIVHTGIDNEDTYITLADSQKVKTSNVSFVCWTSGYWYVVLNNEVYILDERLNSIFYYRLNDVFENAFMADDGLHVYNYNWHVIITPNGADTSIEWDRLYSWTEHCVFSVGDGCDYFKSSGDGIYAGDIGSDENLIVDWNGSYVYGSGIVNFYMPSREFGYILVRETDKTRLYSFKMMSEDEEAIQNKSEIIRVSYFTTSSIDPMQAIAASFNKKHPAVRVVLERIGGDDYKTKINKEYAAGDAPDIIYSSNVDYISLIQKGAFADLYNSGDSSLDSNELFGSIRTVCETSGSLYIIPYTFGVETITAKKGTVNKEDWNLSLFMSMYDEAQSSNHYLLPSCGRKQLLTSLRDAIWGQFIDDKSGRCSFDSVECIQVLDWLSGIPYDIIIDTYTEEHFVNGDIILDMPTINGLFDYLQSKNRWGENSGEIIGIPFSTRNGAHLYIDNLYSINAQSEHIDESMEFLRMFLTNELNTDKISPIKKITKKNAERNKGQIFIYNPLMPGYLRIDEDKPENRTDRSSIYVKITEEVIDDYMSMIDTAYPSAIVPIDVIRIINNELSDLFKGKNVSDIAHNIQSRVSLWYSEKNEY